MLLSKKHTPQDYAAIAWRWRWLIVCPTAIGFFLALVISSRTQDLFRSDMLIQVVPQRVPDSFVRSTVTVRVEERLQALSQQLTSRTQLEQMINEFKLYRNELSRMPMEDVVELMHANIELEVDSVRRGSRGDGSEAFRIRFTHSDPNIAASITQRLGSSIVDQNARDRGTLAEATNNFLETELAQARTRLEAHERKLEQFRMRNAGRLPSQLEFNLQAMQSTQLQVQSLVESLARDRDRKVILDRLYADAQAEPVAVTVAPPGGGADGPPARLSRPQQLELAKANLARLEQRLKPEHPDVARTKRLIADLEKQIQEGIEAGPTSPEAMAGAALTPEQQTRRDRLREMRAELEGLDRQIAFKQSEEQRLRQRFGEYQRRIEAVPGIESESIALTRDYDTLQTTYRELLTKSEASKMAANLERRQIGEQFRVLDPARVPVSPIKTRRLQINLIGISTGLLLGLALVALLEIRDSSFRSESDVVEVLALPVIALVPYVEGPADILRQRRQRALAATATAIAVIAGGYAFWVMKLWKFVV